MDSILLSVKNLLGIPEEVEAFDEQLCMYINSAIFTLSQIGIGPTKKIFNVTSKEDTFQDYLGEEEYKIFSSVPQYLYQKTRLIFDPPTNSFLVEAIKTSITELEWRMRAEMELRASLPEEEPDEGDDEDEDQIPEPDPEQPSEPEVDETE